MSFLLTIARFSYLVCFPISNYWLFSSVPTACQFPCAGPDTSPLPAPLGGGPTSPVDTSAGISERAFRFPPSSARLLPLSRPLPTPVTGRGRVHGRRRGGHMLLLHGGCLGCSCPPARLTVLTPELRVHFLALLLRSNKDAPPPDPPIFHSARLPFPKTGVFVPHSFPLLRAHFSVALPIPPLVLPPFFPSSPVHPPLRPPSCKRSQRRILGGGLATRAPCPIADSSVLL